MHDISVKINISSEADLVEVALPAADTAHRMLPPSLLSPKLHNRRAPGPFARGQYDHPAAGVARDVQPGGRRAPRGRALILVGFAGAAGVGTRRHSRRAVETTVLGLCLTPQQTKGSLASAVTVLPP